MIDKLSLQLCYESSIQEIDHKILTIFKMIYSFHVQ